MRTFPKNEEHHQFLEEAENFLEQADKPDYSRQELAEKLDDRVDLQVNTLKTFLSTHRQEIEDCDDYSLASFEGADGVTGYSMVYWTVKNE